MTVKRMEERFKSMKEDIDTCLSVAVYFPPEDGVDVCSKTLVSTGEPESQLTVSNTFN
jgi:hypothetical protein